VLSVHDRRRMVLRITEQGEELVRRLLPQLSATLRGMLMEFPEAEQRQMITKLKRLRMKLGEATSQGIPERAE
jgi:DNA-binding MarR family transcriptional regulator